MSQKVILNFPTKTTKSKQNRKQSSKQNFVPRYPITSFVPLREQLRDNILLPSQTRQYDYVNPNIRNQVPFNPVVVKDEETKSEVPPQQRSPYLLRRPTTYQSRLV